MSYIFKKNFWRSFNSIIKRNSQIYKKCWIFSRLFPKKNNQIKNKIDDDIKKYYKIKSIICSIYLCYYIRLINEEIRGRFDAELQKTLLKIVNVYSEEKSDEEEANLFEKIKYKKLKDELRGNNIRKFSDLLKIEGLFIRTNRFR